MLSLTEQQPLEQTRRAKKRVRRRTRVKFANRASYPLTSTSFCWLQPCCASLEEAEANALRMIERYKEVEKGWRDMGEIIASIQPHEMAKEFEWLYSKICPSPLTVGMLVFEDLSTAIKYQYRNRIVELVRGNPCNFFRDKETQGAIVTFPDQYYTGPPPVRVTDDFILEVDGLTYEELDELAEFIPPPPPKIVGYTIPEDLIIFDPDEDPTSRMARPTIAPAIFCPAYRRHFYQ